MQEEFLHCASINLVVLVPRPSPNFGNEVFPTVLQLIFYFQVHNILLVDLKRGWRAGGVAPAKVAIIGDY